MKHKLSKHPLYRRWLNMIDRCTNPKAKNFDIYGGRGISVCDRWLDLKLFIEDMNPTFVSGTTLDRINPDGNYTKDNCRWATQKEQQRNRRNNHNITFNGKTRTISAWAEEFGIKHCTLSKRVERMGEQKALEVTAQGLRARDLFTHPRTKLDAGKVEDILLRLQGTASLAALGRLYGVTYNNIASINSGEIWQLVRPDINRPVRK